MSAHKGTPSPVKGRSFEKEVYTRAEIMSLLQETAGSSPTAIRNYALITTLWQSGLRIDEALSLEPRDFSVERQEIFVRHGKGDKARRVAIGPDASAAIQRWLGIRTTLEKIPGHAPLFCTLAGKKLQATYVRSMLQRLAKRAGWTKRIHPHAFRHTFAVNLAKNGMPVPFIQRQLGHSSLSTTSIYLAEISTDDIAEAMRKVEW